MVIGDDDGHAQHLRQTDLLVVGDAAVHGDEQPVLFRHLPHRIAIEAIALLMAGGDAEVRLRAHLPERLQHDGGGRHAVHIIVPVNDDGHARRHCLADDAHGLVHALHEEGIVQLGQIGVQEALRLFRRVDPAIAQKPRQPQRQIADGRGGVRPPADKVQHSVPS